MTLYEKALEIATRAHAGQTRRDGTPYIEHPKIVAKLVRESWINPYPSWFLPISEVIALNHDRAEDANLSEESLIRELEDNHLLEAYSIHSKTIYDALIILNKNNHKSYFEYIKACKFNLFARKVKIADITHNLSDLEKGSLRDKYELALYILKS